MNRAPPLPRRPEGLAGGQLEEGAPGGEVADFDVGGADLVAVVAGEPELDGDRFARIKAPTQISVESSIWKRVSAG